MSLAKIAERANVSLSTVYRVINDVPSVDKDLRAKVEQAMEELAYRPVLRRRRRRRRRSHPKGGKSVGPILMAIAGHNPREIYRLPVFPAILAGVESALNETGRNLIFAGVSGDHETPFRIGDYRCDGIVLMGWTGSLAPGTLDEIARVPTVAVMQPAGRLPGSFDRSLYNNPAIGPLAARYLLDRGHRNAAFLLGDPDHPAFLERQAGFGNAMRAAGARVTDLTISSHAQRSKDEIKSLLESLRQQQPDVSSLFVSNDLMLPALYQSMLELGMAPQKDLDIVSCDNNTSILELIDPPPATLDIRAELIGRHAIRQLLWRIANPDDGCPVTLTVEPELIPAPPIGR